MVLARGLRCTCRTSYRMLTSGRFNNSGRDANWEVKTDVQRTCCKPHIKLAVWKCRLFSILRESLRVFSGSCALYATDVIELRVVSLCFRWAIGHNKESNCGHAQQTVQLFNQYPTS